MAVFGYVRVSTAEQAAHGDSLDAQRRQIEGYAMMKGWDVAQVFIEAGVSAACRSPRGPKVAVSSRPWRGRYRRDREA